jgi:hypothetical protein
VNSALFKNKNILYIPGLERLSHIMRQLERGRLYPDGWILPFYMISDSIIFIPSDM